MQWKIDVAGEFSETPGGRLRDSGPFSGQQFREELLEPRFLGALEDGEKLTINLDGGYGYAASFLEEAFGGLAWKYGMETVLRTILLVSKDEPSLIVDIVGYVSQKTFWKGQNI